MSVSILTLTDSFRVFIWGLRVIKIMDMREYTRLDIGYSWIAKVTEWSKYDQQL